MWLAPDQRKRWAIDAPVTRSGNRLKVRIMLLDIPNTVYMLYLVCGRYSSIAASQDDSQKPLSTFSNDMRSGKTSSSYQDPEA